MKILGFSGKKGSGKDTLTNFLIRNSLELFDYTKIESQAYGEIRTCPNVVKFGFADPLKRFCIDFLGLTNEQCYGTQEQKDTCTSIKWKDMINIDTLLKEDTTGYYQNSLNHLVTAREIMQQVGTNWFRKVNPQIWCNLLLKSIDSAKADYSIIADCRFINECECIKSAGGKVIRLTRKITEDDQHTSETALDNYEGFDAIIDNANLTIEQSERKLVEILTEWGWTKQNKVSTN